MHDPDYDELNDEMGYHFDDYEDTYDEDGEPYVDMWAEDEPFSEQYEPEAEHYSAEYDSYRHDDAYVIYPTSPDDDELPAPFWTRRRLLLLILVIIMIAALLAPSAYNIIQANLSEGGPVYYGPTPTALPSV